jgi:hypothetical protein
VLAALKGIREELESMHSSLADPDEDDDGS